MIHYDVPYRSQWDPDGGMSNNDCGAACVAMLLGYRGQKVSIDSIQQETTAGGGLVSARQLQAAAYHFGLHLSWVPVENINGVRELLEANGPIISLVKYKYLNGKQDTFEGGHFLLVVGCDAVHVITNDPNFRGERRIEGRNKAYLISDFEKAYSSCHADGNPDRYFLVPVKKEEPMPEEIEVLKLRVKELEIDNNRKLGIIEDRDREIVKLKNEVSLLEPSLSSCVKDLKELNTSFDNQVNTIAEKNGIIKDYDRKIYKLEEQLEAWEELDEDSNRIRRELSDIKGALSIIAKVIKKGGE